MFVCELHSSGLGVLIFEKIKLLIKLDFNLLCEKTTFDCYEDTVVDWLNGKPQNNNT